MDHEYIGNLHAHTRYSDGWASHEEVAQAALRSGLDFVVTTDHNIWVQGVQGYYFEGSQRVLVLTGEEVHDAAREPQKNHLLVYGAEAELAPLAAQPQQLLREVHRLGGLSFLAHPVDPSAPLFGEPDLSWVDWSVDGFTGIELWNYMAQHKVWLRNWPLTIAASLLPTWFARGPSPAILRLWDEALAAGKTWIAIGGADAHGLPVQLGPFHRIIFPYEFLFRNVNTHVVCEEPWTGEAKTDARRLYESLAAGRCFIGFDRASPTRGFRFSAVDDHGPVPMGGKARARFGVTFQVRTPRPAEIDLIHHGRVVRRWVESESAVHVAEETGAYRVAVRLPFRGRLRDWIFSNPITVRR